MYSYPDVRRPRPFISSTPAYVNDCEDNCNCHELLENSYFSRQAWYF